MPKNKKAKNSKNNCQEERRTIMGKDDDEQEYARVTKALGSARFRVKLSLSGKEVIAKLRGAMRGGRRKRKNFVETGSVVLVSVRGFQDCIVDIIHVYDHVEVRQLKKSGKFVEVDDGGPRLENVQDEDEDDCVFDFEDL